MSSRQSCAKSGEYRRSSNRTKRYISTMPMTTSPSIHPSKDVNHAGSWERGDGRRTSFSAGVECNCASHGNSLHFATRRSEGEDRRASHYYTHAPSLPLSLSPSSLGNSDVRESMLHQFCLNQLEGTVRRNSFSGPHHFASSFPPLFSPSINLQFAPRPR